jgi:hypothetical protein
MIYINTIAALNLILELFCERLKTESIGFHVDAMSGFLFETKVDQRLNSGNQPPE